MADEAVTALNCPKDGALMRPMGRGVGAWRCQDCRSVFLDTESMRGARGGRPPVWVSILASLILSVVARRLARRLRRGARPAGKT